MAHNTPGPEGNYDPAGSTQMFRAFVDEGEPHRPVAAAAQSGPRVGLILTVLAIAAVLAGVAWLALS
ncbi:hypothetical protein ACM614_06270 [Streptomyces sp. 12297]|uniref:hypothetical protein n=1 Tax=Streptomyces sp. NBC_00239 TaxID=2903640 RepID=UPI002E28A400|nr:hypothetical protein [Streptomyces sp. NBC_00239]